MITPFFVYILCSATSVAVAVALFRSYRRTSVRFLLWSALCFVGLSLSNFVLVLDMVIFPTSCDLSIPRTLLALLGVATLLYGFIWDVS